MPTFEDLLAEAEAGAREFSGWDFSRIDHRIVQARTPWDYAARVNELAEGAHTFVDLGTGGGEFASTIAPRPVRFVATEGYMPNVPIAARRLRPLRIHVVAYEGSPDNVDQDRSTPLTLPFRDGSFDVVVNRHEAFNAPDVSRVLKRGGTFFTQQIGARDCMELCDELGATPQPAPDIQQYRGQLRDAGLRVRTAAESFSAKTYLDTGALLYYVLAIPWAFVGFSLETHREALRQIHEQIERDGGFTTNEHRLLFEASKT